MPSPKKVGGNGKKVATTIYLKLMIVVLLQQHKANPVPASCQPGYKPALSKLGSASRSVSVRAKYYGIPQVDFSLGSSSYFSIDRCSGVGGRARTQAVFAGQLALAHPPPEAKGKLGYFYSNRRFPTKATSL